MTAPQEPPGGGMAMAVKVEAMFTPTPSQLGVQDVVLAGMPMKMLSIVTPSTTMNVFLDPAEWRKTLDLWMTQDSGIERAPASVLQLPRRP